MYQIGDFHSTQKDSEAFMDLLSTIVQLRSRQSIPHFGYAGRQVQAWFLREIGRNAPSLAEQLHDGIDSSGETNDQRPYTLSTVYKGPGVPRALSEGDWCWVRITSFTQELSQYLFESVLPNLMSVARIGQVEFDVIQWKPESTGDPRLSSRTYESLAHQAVESDETRIRLEYTSPTTFKERSKSGGVEKDVPLPNPDQVFGGYIRQWREFSPIPLPEDIGEFIDECLAVGELKNLQTERIQFSYSDPHRAAVGFTGQVTFRILGGQFKSRFGEDWADYAAVVRAMALFSFFCGTGRRTTLGMGQTR